MDNFERATLDPCSVRRTNEALLAKFRAEPWYFKPFQIETEADVVTLLERVRLDNDELWKNGTYTVAIRHIDAQAEGWPAMTHLSIKRNDRGMIEDWRELQEIKNQLVGQEYEAVQLYPAESRRVDSANQWHLWCLTDPEVRFPFGFTARLVDDSALADSKQRPLDGNRPDRRTPWDIAESWYSETDIANSIQRSGDRGFGSVDNMPEDVHGPEFAKWLTHQYRLAMAKGIQLGRDGSEDLDIRHMEDAP